MSFVILDNGEFPPLNKMNQSIKISNSQKTNSNSNSNKQSSSTTIHNKSIKEQDGNHHYEKHSVFTSEDFVNCRVGIELNDYDSDLDFVLRKHNIGINGDFLLVPLEFKSTKPYDETNHNENELLPDLALPVDVWQSRIAIYIDHPMMLNYHKSKQIRFNQLFRHAMYLTCPVIIINCPKSYIALLSIASTVNDILKESKCNQPLILFKFLDKQTQDPLKVWESAIEKVDKDVIEKINNTSNRCYTKKISTQQSSKMNIDPCDQKWKLNNSSESILSNDSESHESEELARSDSTTSTVFSTSSDNNSQEQPKTTRLPKIPDQWKEWNKLRSHLAPDRNLGVCLTVDNYLLECEDEAILNRWTGEPVRLLIIPINQFIRQPGNFKSIKLTIKCKKFIEMIVKANSHKTSLVVGSSEYPNEDVTDYVKHLEELSKIIRANKHVLEDWNDRIQTPLQPLSSDLSSGTYTVFEMDSIKYISYKMAMKEALTNLITDDVDKKRKKFILMVLGAGRGPLVDAFIEALQEIKSISPGYKYKIYALDKNPCSVVSLKYKQTHLWTGANGLYETEVVQSDMRDWRPGLKADIIVSELLGSLGDNELSPECIDGIWKLAHNATICIPQEYSSYISPICSYKIKQELNVLSSVETNVYDKIYVSRLSNYFPISEPQVLFEFSHYNLNEDPRSKCNERYAKLTFWPKTDAVCHGFSGYFTAKLFGSINLSTVPSSKTPGMESWFPAFIPLDEPIQLSRNTKLVIHFWRKESQTNVWYEWVITKPIRSRIYSPKGLATAMSKFI